jgi:hypothetical protein
MAVTITDSGKRVVRRKNVEVDLSDLTTLHPDIETFVSSLGDRIRVEACQVCGPVPATVYVDVMTEGSLSLRLSTYSEETEYEYQCRLAIDRDTKEFEQKAERELYEFLKAKFEPELISGNNPEPPPVAPDTAG